MSGIYGKGAKGRASKLHAELVRSRGRCERCGKTDVRLECAHIVSRRYAATRSDENGAWCLCSYCHRYLTENPYEHVQFAIKTLGEDGYRKLLDKAYATVGQRLGEAFWKSECERLAALLKEAEAA